ncbi:unnamed protein product [Orchesella dallaii]|uniref:Uncharacterized protein n=1 Tax=Orchesella dallaii TaxID=48710 RepID=A0ABP1QW72_9HEXA
MKVKLQDAIVDYYTDILAHCFEPNGDRLGVGTTTGKIVVLERDDNTQITHVADTMLPGNSAVLGLHWSSKGIFIGAKSLLYLLKPEDIHHQVGAAPLPYVKFECLANVFDVCSQAPNDEKVFGACDDCKIRVWDVETQQQISELADHKSVVEVCNANDEYLVTGSQDGKIYVYESNLRTKKPVISFEVGKQTISGLDISQNSTWLAAGCKGSPIIYNLRNVATLPEIEVEKPGKIYTVHFDKQNNLWWSGTPGIVYRSSDLTGISAKLKSSFGETSIYHVFSLTSSNNCFSAAGSSTGILFSENGDYWEEMIHL